MAQSTRHTVRSGIDFAALPNPLLNTHVSKGDLTLAGDFMEIRDINRTGWHGVKRLIRIGEDSVSNPSGDWPSSQVLIRFLSLSSQMPS